MKNTEKKPFYQKVWFMALISCFVPIAGIILMWKFKPNWNKIAKVILTVVASFWMLLLVAFCFADGSETPADHTSVPQTTISAEKTTEETPKTSESSTNSDDAALTSTTTAASTTESTENTTKSTTTSKETITEKSTTTKKKTTTTTKKPTTTKKQTTTKKATTANPGYRDVVYITPSGKRYHVSKDCAGKNAIEKSLKDVQASYGPCQTCSK